MPRNHATPASTLRNRNRITQKSRIRIHQGDLEADPAILSDEIDEKHRFNNLVAGVDAEDANEHHLQEVLSAVHRSNSSSSKPTSRDQKAVAAPAAYIPTPDSTGVVANADDLYPPGKWKDPFTYVFSSTTAEETTQDGIANGFTYYMDERDKEWLDKNNEEARGEGTSVQGALLTPGRVSRSAKAKGKEPEVAQPVVISEDEFEMIMGIFEKVTHERTEYLHHGLKNGMEFPLFSEYQDVFVSPLPASMFSTYSIPTWLPQPQNLVKMARAVYPYWKERRIERGGHRIIPVLNFDEADTENESYVCFRRRETKAVRKTRASQVSSSDKLARLHLELAFPLELAKALVNRETLKKQSAIQGQVVWEQRLAFTDLKRKFPALNDRIDEELLVDKERPLKRIDPGRMRGLTIKTGDPVTPPRQEVVIRPKDRVQLIRDQVNAILERQKERDHHWEDVLGNPYQTPPTAYASKLFSFPTSDVSSLPSPSSDQTDDEATPSPPTRLPRAARIRYGRGGRIHLDRRDNVPRRIAEKRLPRSSLFSLEDENAIEEVDALHGDTRERREALYERWKFDVDDAPPVGPEGADEQDRELVDDYDSTYMRHAMQLFQDQDHGHLVTEPTIVVAGPEGRLQGIVPYRLGIPHPQVLLRRDAQGVVRQYNFQSMPVAMQHQIKKMQQQPSQMRISSNGGMRPPSVPVSNLQQQQQAQAAQAAQAQAQLTSQMPQTPQTPQQQPAQLNGSPSPAPPQSSPPRAPAVPIPISQPANANGVNGASRPAISMPQLDINKVPDLLSSPAIPNNAINGLNSIPQAEPNAEAILNGIPRPKSQNLTPQQHHQQFLQQAQAGLAVPNSGYQLTNLPSTSQANQAMAYQLQQQLNGAGGGQSHGQVGGLSMQQVQNLKSAFANLPASEVAAAALNGRPLANYMMPNSPSVPNGMANGMVLPQGTNMNMKIPASRQMQWAALNQMQQQQQQQQQRGSVPNGLDMYANLVNGLHNGHGHSNGMASPNGMMNGMALPNGMQVPVRSASANGSRAGMRNGMGMSVGVGMNGVVGMNGQLNGHHNGHHSMSMSPPQHMRHTPSPLPNISQSQSPPRLPMTPNMGMASPPLMQQQQSLGGNQNGY